MRHVGPPGSGCRSVMTRGFPESSRVLALLGADLLVVPTNWPTHAECAAEHADGDAGDGERRLCDRGQPDWRRERTSVSSAGSSIAGTGGERLAFAGSGRRRDPRSPDIDPSTSPRTKRQVRVTGKHVIDRFADRRPEFYAPDRRARTEPSRLTPSIRVARVRVPSARMPPSIRTDSALGKGLPMPDRSRPGHRRLRFALGRDRLGQRLGPVLGPTLDSLDGLPERGRMEIVVVDDSSAARPAPAAPRSVPSTSC